VTEYSFVPMTYVGEDILRADVCAVPRTGYFEYGVLAYRDPQGEGGAGSQPLVEIQPCLIFAVPTFAMPTPRR
jgi:hypothetical protein